MHSFQELIVRSLQGRTTPAEERRLLLWRESSPENDASYRQAVELWSITQVAQPEGPSRGPPRAEDLTSSIGRVRRRRAERSRSNRHALVAAALIAVVFGTAKVWVKRSTAEPSQYQTGATEMVTVTLPDGSYARLAPRSRLRFVNGEHERSAWLQGEAFFAVAENHRVPFVVRTQLGNASVLGTRFDLRVDEAELRLVVLEGKVRLDAAASEVEVDPGEVSRVRRGATPTVDSVGDVYSYVDWLGGTFVFQSTPLPEALDEIEHRFDRRIVLVDSSLASRTVTAWFTDRPFEEVIAAVSRVVQATWNIDESGASVGR